MLQRQDVVHQRYQLQQKLGQNASLDTPRPTSAGILCSSTQLALTGFLQSK